MHAYERQAYEMADGRYTPMGEARIREMHACEMHACEMHACEMHACEMHACEMHAYERHAYEMAPVRGTPMGWPMRDARP
jgi:hypothetical protein